MMKKILSAAFAAMMLMAIPATAQNTAADQAKCAKTECSKDNKINKDKGACREFEGLTLTDTQKEKLQQLKANQREARQAQKEQAKMDRKADKEQREAERKAMKEQREAERRAYLKEVKNIVGPENYVIYLENMYVTAPMQNQMGPKGPGFDRSVGAKHAKASKQMDKKYRKGGKAVKGQYSKPASRETAKTATEKV